MVLFQVKVICTDNESVCMVFFNCVVAKICWSYLNDIFLIDLGSNFEPMARWWVSNNRYKVMNCCSAALMWCLWKTRNEMCFQGKKWLDKKVVIRKMVNTLRVPVQQAATTTSSGNELTAVELPGGDRVFFGSICWDGNLQKCSVNNTFA